MEEIVCANTAFRYWRCPPQVRDIYPRYPAPMTAGGPYPKPLS